MSDRILKLLGTEQALLSATTFESAQLIRIFNDTANPVLVSTIDENDNTTGTVTIKAGEIVFIRKKAAEAITTSASVKAVAVAFGD